jgi:hypothetical protein
MIVPRHVLEGFVALVIDSQLQASVLMSADSPNIADKSLSKYFLCDADERRAAKSPSTIFPK